MARAEGVLSFRSYLTKHPGGEASNLQKAGGGEFHRVTLGRLRDSQAFAPSPMQQSQTLPAPGSGSQGCAPWSRRPGCGAAAVSFTWTAPSGRGASAAGTGCGKPARFLAAGTGRKSAGPAGRGRGGAGAGPGPGRGIGQPGAGAGPRWTNRIGASLSTAILVDEPSEPRGTRNREVQAAGSAGRPAPGSKTGRCGPQPGPAGAPGGPRGALRALLGAGGAGEKGRRREDGAAPAARGGGGGGQGGGGGSRPRGASSFLLSTGLCRFNGRGKVRLKAGRGS